ncbi:MAG: helix-turn-helix transcriptional regulator [Clostridiales bacterium]|nr:helix-turn-helix transcriptional regulator [Clostridiales bacterium]
MDYVDLGRRIRKQRTSLGWTQEALAEKIGVSTSFVGHVERGSRKASLETIVALSNSLGVSLDYLLAGSLNNSGLGPVPQNLNSNQRMALQEILSTIQGQLVDWNKPTE